MSKYSDITEEQKLQWKQQYGEHNVFEVEVEEDGERPAARFVIRRPGRLVVDSVANHGVKKDIVNANKVLTKNCVLGGDMDIMENEGDVYEEVLKQLSELTQKRKSSIKKL